MGMDFTQAKQRIEQLKAVLWENSRKYYVENAPTMSDYEYDQLMHELEDLEREYPEYATADSPTRRVGSDLETGFEAYAFTKLPLLEAKRMACRIEEEHPLGRLFDIDVIDPTGTPVSRQSIGVEPRRCLLCEREARYCMRNHTHSREELQARIEKIVDEYVHGGL